MTFPTYQSHVATIGQILNAAVVESTRLLKYLVVAHGAHVNGGQPVISSLVVTND